MNPLSQAAIDMMHGELQKFAWLHGIRIVISSELNPEFSDETHCVSVISPQRDSMAKFLGKTQIESARRALFHIHNILMEQPKQPLTPPGHPSPTPEQQSE